MYLLVFATLLHKRTLFKKTEMNVKSLYISLTSLLLFASCCPEVDQETFTFNIETVSPQHFNHSNIEFISGSSVSASSYALVINTTAPEILNATSQSGGGGIFRSPTCDKDVAPRFQLADNIVSINITSTVDFSSDYPAGASLNDLFSPIRITKDNPFSDPTSLVQSTPSGTINFDLFNSDLVNHHDAIDFRNQEDTSFDGFELIAQPDTPIQLQFRLEFTFQSGRKISGLTSLITLEN